MTVLILAGAIAVERWHHGNQRYTEGKDEVRVAWDKDKEIRKAEADKQAADTAKTNKEKQDALNHTKADLRVTRAGLDVALERLRNLPGVPGEEGVRVAGGGCQAVPSVANNSSGAGGGIKQRIGGCEDTGSDPCFSTREFFEQAIKDASDRRLTREWAAGQGIQTVGVEK